LERRFPKIVEVPTIEQLNKSAGRSVSGSKSALGRWLLALGQSSQQLTSSATLGTAENRLAADLRRSAQIGEGVHRGDAEARRNQTFETRRK
ncbi:MAG: hypothetical protein ACXV78_14680, partial [Candidatus Angelobacter sp.]